MNPLATKIIDKTVQKIAAVSLFGEICITGNATQFVTTLLQVVFENNTTVANHKRENTRPNIVVPISMNDVVGWMKNKQVRAAIKSVDILVTDGMPLVWLAKCKGIFNANRLYGPTLMKLIINHGRKYGAKHYFYGGTESTLKQLTAKLAMQYPGYYLSGTFAPPFRELSDIELKEFIAQITKVKPDILWLGIGSWKQVVLASKLRNKLAVPLILPVGAAFDFLAQQKPQAPIWLQQLGMEWCFRLLHEPRRLWRRYLLQIPIFIVFSILELVNYYRNPNKTSDNLHI